MEKLVNPKRRNLFGGKIRQKKHLRLPWVSDNQTFIDQCNQCGDCLAACENKIIVKDEQGYPKIDFSLGECSFCQKCIKSCAQDFFVNVPTSTTNDDKEKMAWPISFNINEQCLAKNQIYCQSCQDACQPQAIIFSHLIGEEIKAIPEPKLNITDCNQCGACISACPQQAITFNIQ